jgi:hypothetical protein
MAILAACREEGRWRICGRRWGTVLTVGAHSKHPIKIHQGLPSMWFRVLKEVLESPIKLGSIRQEFFLGQKPSDWVRWFHLLVNLLRELERKEAESMS